MKVVILCGGKGTRLREETEYRPKPMVPIGRHPILWHIKNLPEALKYYELAVQYDAPPSRFVDAVAAVKKDMETAAKNSP
jgi:molybdopterin-guanine dinucleotide biosynthesis protein A